MGLQIDLFTGELTLPPPSEELDQWFSRPKVADAFARWAGITPGMRVLEPSAGEGALLKASPDARWTAVELDTDRAEWIERHGWADRVIAGDFLKLAPDLGEYELVHQNPPYSNGLDTRFVEACIEHKLAPRITGLLATNFLHSETRRKRIWRWVKLTRLGLLSTRPQFGQAAGKADGPKRDYAFFEMKIRKTARRNAAADTPKVTWLNVAS
jgi:hypothetical protein